MTFRPVSDTIIRIDSLQRYCDIMSSMPNSKEVYYQLCDKYGNLWSSYGKFMSWKHRYQNKLPGQGMRSALTKEYLSIMADAIQPHSLFDIIAQEYPGLWKTRLYFQKFKYIYLKKRLLSI